MAGIAQARKARLGVPRVQRPRRPQQGPRLGQAQKPYHPRAGLAQRVVAKASLSPSPATTPAQPSNASVATTVPATQSTPMEPLASAPPAPKAPSSLFELPAWSGQGEDPRDATYWANISKLKFADEQKYSEGLREQQMADTGYNDALQTAIRNRAVQQRTLGENAIRGNLGNSGWLDRNEAEDTTAYTQERGHAQLQKTEEDAARAAARNALREGFGIEAAGELGEAAARLAQRKQEEAERAEALAAMQQQSTSGSGGEEESSGDGWSGEAPTGESFFGSGKKKSSPKKIALGQRRKAR